MVVVAARCKGDRELGWNSGDMSLWIGEWCFLPPPPPHKAHRPSPAHVRARAACYCCACMFRSAPSAGECICWRDGTAWLWWHLVLLVCSCQRTKGPRHLSSSCHHHHTAECLPMKCQEELIGEGSGEEGQCATADGASGGLHSCCPLLSLSLSCTL